MKLRDLIIILFFLSITISSSLFAQDLRAFSELFPNIGAIQKNAIFSADGLIRTIKKNEALEFLPTQTSGIDLRTIVMKGSPSYLAESLLVVPYRGLTKLDAYNALCRVRDLKGRLYRSHTRNAEVPLFEDATRIDSVQKNNPIADPPIAYILPASEIFYLRLKDINFGNSFYRGDMSAGPYGITYSLGNVKSLKYMLFTVMGEEKFSAVLYMEPLEEGMLVYSMAGADASDFISGKIDIPSAISKRLSVFIAWICDGLKSSL